MSTPETDRRPEVVSPKAALTASLAVFGASLLSLCLLGQYLGVAPGSPYSHESIDLFSGDGAWRWKRLSGAVRPYLEAAHFLLDFFWGRVGGMLARILELAEPREAAQFDAAVGLVCAVAAAGFGGLALISSRLNHRRWNLLLLYPVYLLFTANVIIVQPDHFGLSFGLLVAASLALFPDWSDRARAKLLVVTGVLNIVTTITNVLFPLLVAAVVFRGRVSRPNTKFLLCGSLAAGMVSAPLVAAAVVQWNYFNPVTGFANWRLVRNPLDAARFAGLGLVHPAVGPKPIVRRDSNSSIRFCLEYNGARLSDYGPVSGAAACAWVALLAASSIVLIRSPDLRNYCYALFGWIAFNLVFHNIWGDEFFLYSPHWSWALMLIVLLGSRALPTWAVAVAVAVIIPGQLSTLSTIRELVFA